MCFASSQNKKVLELAQRYGRKGDAALGKVMDEQRRISAFTHPVCAIVTGDEQLQAARWGLVPFWVKDAAGANEIWKKTLNARSETVFELPSFRQAIRRRRCLFPSTGYYEFHHSPGSAVKGKKDVITEYFITVREVEIFSIAGIYDEWKNPCDGGVMVTFSALTCEANSLCKEIHNGGKNPGRMPVILPVELEAEWLRGDLPEEDVRGMLRAMPSEGMDAAICCKCNHFI
jgi:putative SOS response-associated peptidase YedK